MANGRERPSKQISYGRSRPYEPRTGTENSKMYPNPRPKKGSELQASPQKRQAPQSRPPKSKDPPKKRREREPGILLTLFSLFFRALSAKTGRLFAIILCSISVYLLFVGIYAGTYLYRFYHGTTITDDIEVHFLRGEQDEEPTTETYSYEQIFRNGKHIYINMAWISEDCELMTVGNSRQIRYILADGSNDSAIFRNNSCHITVNGNDIVLPAPVHIRNNIVYVPIEFFHYYTDGYEISYNGTSRILRIIKETVPSTDRDENPKFITFTYTTRANTASEKIDERTIINVPANTPSP